jgi:hypothetical protein
VVGKAFSGVKKWNGRLERRDGVNRGDCVPDISRSLARIVTGLTATVMFWRIVPE